MKIVMKAAVLMAVPAMLILLPIFGIAAIAQSSNEPAGQTILIPGVHIATTDHSFAVAYAAHYQLMKTPIGYVYVGH